MAGSAQEIRRKKRELESLLEKKRILESDDQIRTGRPRGGAAGKKARASGGAAGGKGDGAKKGGAKGPGATGGAHAKKGGAKKGKAGGAKKPGAAGKRRAASGKGKDGKREGAKKPGAAGKKGGKAGGAKRGGGRRAKKGGSAGRPRRRRRPMTPEEEEDITDEEALEEGITDEEIANFQVGKANMEQLINRVCEMLSSGPSGGTLQGDVWRRLKLTLSDGFRLALKLEWLGLITREKVLENGRWTYRLILKRTPISTRSIVNAPCLTCPVEQKCTPDGEVSPHTCDLIRDWVLAESKRARRRA